MKDFTSVSADIWERNNSVLYSHYDIIGECWVWNMCKNKDGYGMFGWKWECGRGTGHTTIELAHRISWIVSHHSNPPQGMYICHTCDNPACINPTHLFCGTQTDNMLDMKRKGRQPNNKGERNPMAKLSIRDVEYIRSTERGAKDIARIFGVSSTTVNLIRNGTIWRQE